MGWRAVSRGVGMAWTIISIRSWMMTVSPRLPVLSAAEGLASVAGHCREETMWLASEARHDKGNTGLEERVDVPCEIGRMAGLWPS
jgi:hypothetical protein